MVSRLAGTTGKPALSTGIKDPELDPGKRSWVEDMAHTWVISADGEIHGDEPSSCLDGWACETERRRRRVTELEIVTESDRRWSCSAFYRKRRILKTRHKTRPCREIKNKIMEINFPVRIPVYGKDMMVNIRRLGWLKVIICTVVLMALQWLFGLICWIFWLNKDCSCLRLKDIICKFIANGNETCTQWSDSARCCMASLEKIYERRRNK